VDEMPKYSDKEDLISYIMNNYKPIAEESQYRFNLQVVIDSNGHSQGIRVRSKEKNDYTKSEIEMIKVLEKIPEWLPGKCSGHNVDVLFNIPIMISYRD